MEHVLAVIRFLGLELDEEQLDQLRLYEDWLRTEAYRAGGIGPEELDRLERRHIADSLLFACGFEHESPEVWDLGTGVGLPGIPLAIALPTTRFVLVDRSGRRIDLLRRAIRILDLSNCEAVHGEIDRLTGETSVIVARASLPPDAMRAVADKHLIPGGMAVLAGSWRQEPSHEGWTTREIPPEVLDQRIWLLIMRRA